MTNCKAICANWVGGWRKTPVRVVATRARGDSETSQIRFCWINLFSYRPPLTGDLQIVKLWESEFSRITCISYRNTTWHKSQVLSSLAYVMQEAPYPIIFDTPLPTHYKKKRLNLQQLILAGKVTSFEKFYLIRQLSKKPGRAVWRKVTLRPPGLESADASLACCCDNKKPGNPAPLSLDPLFHQLEAGERKSEKHII